MDGGSSVSGASRSPAASSVPTSSDPSGYAGATRAPGVGDMVPEHMQRLTVGGYCVELK